MRLLLSSVLLGLVWFTAINAAASLVAWLLGRSLLGRSDPSGAGPLLLVRLLPAAVSAVFVATVFLPTHWRFEPVESEESFGVLLAVVAGTGLWLLLAAAWRAMRAGLAGHRFAILTRRAARPVGGHAVASGVRVVDGLYGVSLAGVWRPSVFIGSDTCTILTSAELDLAISHELAHRRANDNLKRFSMCCAPDLFGWTRVARGLEDRWQAAAECDADAGAVRGDAERAVVLASALVKVARLKPVVRASGIGSAAISSAFHIPGLLEMRVRRLVSAPAPSQSGAARLGWSSATLGVGILAALWLLGFSGTLHSVTEALVRRLP